MEEKNIYFEKSEIIKLLRLEQNYLKDRYNKGDDESKSINKTKEYKHLMNNLNKLNESEIENLKKFSKKFSEISLLLSGFCNFLAGYNLCNQNIKGFILDLILSLLCAYLYVMYRMINEILKKEWNELSGGYSTLTKIKNIDNSIEFLQSLIEEEQIKYLKLKL